MTDRQGINRSVSPSLFRRLQDIRTSEIPSTVISDIEDNTKRWLVVGICLHTEVCPVLRTYIKPVLSQLYSSMTVINNIHTQTYPNQLKSFGAKKIYLNYAAINNNKVQHGRDFCQYDYKVKDEMDLSKLFLMETYSTKYKSFDNSCDAAALFGIIINIDSFPTVVKGCVKKIRDHIRNPWAHCNLDVWDNVMFSTAFSIMNNAIKQLNLSQEEQKKTEEILQSWEKKGLALLSGTCGIELVKELKTETQTLAEYLLTTTHQTDEELLNQQKAQEALNTMTKSFSDKIHSIEKRLDAVENRTVVLKGQIESHIPKNIRDQIQVTVDTWKQEDNKFVTTTAAHYVFDCIKEHGCVTITGSPGAGKTSTARHIALSFLRLKYSIVPVYVPIDLKTYYQPGHPTVFIVDDICGNFVANKQQIHSWLQIKEVILQIVKDKCCKIIVCCRLQVYKDEKFKKLLPLFKHECNLNSNSLTHQEQHDIFQAYFENEAFPFCEDEVKSSMFPLLCSLCPYNTTSVAFKRFFSNPYKVYETEFDNLYDDKAEGRHKLCALAVCVLFNNNLNEIWLDSKSTSNESKMLEELSDELGFEQIARKSNLKQELDTMVGTFLSKENGTYKSLQDTIFDFLAFYFGQKIMQCIIDHGDTTFIQERLISPDLALEVETYDEYSILIPADKIERYIKRLIYDWKQGNVSCVLDNLNFKMTPFREEFLQQIQQLSICDQKQLANMSDNDDGTNGSSCGNTTLGLISIHGYSDMLDWALGCNPDVNKCNKYGTSPLLAACELEHLNIVCKLLEKNADINKCAEVELSLKQTTLSLTYQNNVLSTFVTLPEYKETFNMSINTGALPLSDEDVKISTDIALERLKSFSGLMFRSSPLLCACKNRNLELVCKLLERNADVNMCVRDGLSPLLFMCMIGDLDIVCKLLEKNADVNKCMNDGLSPLNIACTMRHSDIVCKLLEKNADVNKRFTDEGLFPLLTACEIGDNDMVCKLIEKNAVVDMCRKDGTSPLHLACEGGHLDIVCKLLEKNADVDMCCNDGTSPLYLACEGGHSDIVCKLLEKNADVNKWLNDRTSSPLYIASQEGYSDIVCMLLEKNADVKMCCSDDGLFPLMIACAKGHKDIVSNLLEKNADANMRWTRNGISPLYVACENGHSEVVCTLLENNADVNMVGNDGKSPLYIACQSGQLNIVCKLLENNADVNMSCAKYGRTALGISCCVKGHLDIVSELLRMNADVNKTDFMLCTPLTRACQTGDFEKAEILIKHNAYLNTQMYNGDTALLSAVRCDNQNLVELLIKNGADYNTKIHTEEVLKSNLPNQPKCTLEKESQHWNKCIIAKVSGSVKKYITSKPNGYIFSLCTGSSPLHFACFMGLEKICKLLINNKAEVNLSKDDGTTPLFYACEFGHLNLVRLLLDNNGTNDIFGRDRKYPLIIATRNGHFEIASLIMERENMFADIKVPYS